MKVQNLEVKISCFVFDMILVTLGGIVLGCRAELDLLGSR